VFRIRVGREINSAALIADGYHARTDGLTSLAVVIGAMGVWLGFPLADPIVGLLITIAIFGIVWQSAKAVLTRMLDGVDPSIVSEMRHAAEHVAGLKQVLDIKARWLGHRLHADVAVLVNDMLSVADADVLGAKLKRELFAHIPALSAVNVRVHGSDPASGDAQGASREGGHHHAPTPFKVASPLAYGLLEIIDTPKGERMRLTVDRHAEELRAEELRATVTIDREGGKVETLSLVPVSGDHNVFMSGSAPAEPHEFEAQLRLQAGDQKDVLLFRMVEPEGHNHELDDYRANLTKSEEA
jgi:hypothetical protein